MSSRTIQTNTTVSGQITSPKHVTSAQITSAGIAGHTIEHWGDGAYWDVTSSKPVNIDSLNITGTPRAQD